ncbi:DUF4232 domain-containing protein [Streptomyces sp. ID01-12c]|uniref:DUF4232 domain-containing protein n=1 Tax=Streptomyces caniscabiei TaxID=2746961 RepID=A0A927L8E4_9ACTN|nr:DUF4232 domain-containing protein [Streptomyces caniscabiei]MBD9703131.1 DUF4232 domain-containing protein [Streptomyces caniscabiei]MBD9727537.1 DUF4232 domain-containing protein [Streptomyces caniscabiei]MDX3513058.1 DUF4232 domain-containing protein [Streptomyces caniscabiei]MDX3722096.1 DUF4232 domain-containing protein [Streptomyces caniscabiei]MDX3732195.1 DUF4232 domain-containing protein [Streptomyces caniscabiei]
MRTLRTARSARTARPARLLAVTGAALAALALTACDNGTGTRDEGASGGSTSASQGTGSSGSSTGGTGTSGGSSTGGSTTGGTSTSGNSTGDTSADKAASKGGTSDSSEPENRVACNGSHTTVTAQPVSRPLNHLLITVKNTGSQYCDLYYNPTVRFGEAQSAPRVFEESQPQAVVTLAPGESGYAGVLLAAADGSGGEGTTEKKVVIHFQGPEAGSDAGSPASPALPAEGVHVDNSVAVTYWQSTMEDALQY